MRGKSKKILIGIVVVSVLLIGNYVFSLVRAKGRLRAAYAALEQDGRPMQVEDVLGPEVPDAENAAVLYTRALALAKTESAGDRNLLEYLAKHANSFLKGSLEPDERAKFERLAQHDAVTEALSLVAEGNQRPACRFQVPEEITLHEDPPSAQGVRDLGVVLGVRAYLVAKQGRLPEAWETAGVQLRFANKLRSDPLVPGPWTKFGLTGHACRVVRKLCEIAPPDDQEYGRIEALLRELDALEPFIRCVDAERLAVGERLFSMPEDELFAVLQRDPWSGSDGTPNVFDRLSFRFMMYGPRFITDHATYLQVSCKSVRLLEGPYASHESAAIQEIRDLSGRYGLTRRLGLGGYILTALYCRMANDVRTVRAGLALLRYKQAHGDFPATLEALNLEGLVDPYNQQPLRYRAEGDGFVVYSVGGDLKDNNGLLEAPRRSSDPRQKKDPEHDRGWRFGQAEEDAEDQAR